MTGITAAFLGTVVGAGAELRFTGEGKAVLSFSCLIYDPKRPESTSATFARVSCWEVLAEQLEGTLPKGTEIYVEGKLTITNYTVKDGEQRTGVNVSAWKVEPLGKIGRSAPKRRPVDEHRQSALQLEPVRVAGGRKPPWEESA